MAADSGVVSIPYSEIHRGNLVAANQGPRPLAGKETEGGKR